MERSVYAALNMNSSVSEQTTKAQWVYWPPDRIQLASPEVYIAAP